MHMIFLRIGSFRTSETDRIGKHSGHIYHIFALLSTLNKLQNNAGS